MRNGTNRTPPKFGNYRMGKIRSAAGNYLPGMMRTGRTTENGDLNVLAANRGQQKTEPTSPSQQQPSTGRKTRSPSPARRPSNATGTPQKTRAPVTSTAAKHCHQCGEAFPVDWAKFCCGCGEKRYGFE